MYRRSRSISVVERVIAPVVTLAIGVVVAVFDARAEDTVAKEANIVIDAPVFDFGTVSQGSHVTHDFVVRNGGTGDLVINRVVATCGCTATSATNENIAPGATTTVHVDFDTKGFAGERVKTVRVFSNDPDEPSTLLTLRGVIEQDVVVTPSRVVFNSVLQGDTTKSYEADVDIKVRQGSPVKISSVKGFSQYLDVKEIKSSDKNKTVKVVLKPEAPLGEFRDRLIVNLEGEDRTSINIPVFAVIEGPWRLKPGSLSFGIIEGSAEVKKTSTVESTGDAKIAITKVSADHAAVRVDYETLEPGKRYAINVHVDPKKVGRELKSAINIIGTADAHEQRLSLSVYGMSPPKAGS